MTPYEGLRVAITFLVMILPIGKWWAKTIIKAVKENKKNE